VKSIGRIFVGICKCGAWGCFDEFNRLDEAVLSAVSMQIQVIQDSLRSRSGKTFLLGKEVNKLLFRLILIIINYIILT
jgi:dynein heavy chain 2